MFEVLYRNECEEEKALRDSAVLVFKDVEKMICPECGGVSSYIRKKNIVGNNYIKCNDCGFEILENNESGLHIIELKKEDYPLKDSVFKTGEKLCYDEENNTIWMFASFVNIILEDKIVHQTFHYRFTVDLKQKTVMFTGPKLIGKGEVYGINPFTIDYNLCDIYSKEMIDVFVEKVKLAFDCEIDWSKSIRDIQKNISGLC